MMRGAAAKASEKRIKRKREKWESKSKRRMGVSPEKEQLEMGQRHVKERGR